MKTKISSLILIVFVLFGMTACQSDQNEVETTQPQATNTEVPTVEVESGYPVSESTPTKAEPQSDVESAYPVTEDDLQMLYHTWSLTGYFVDEVSQGAARQTIKFNADGTYEITTDETFTTGQWRTRLTAVDSLLILESEEGVKTYEIIDLSSSALNLRSTQDNMQIDEQYLPAD